MSPIAGSAIHRDLPCPENGLNGGFRNPGVGLRKSKRADDILHQMLAKNLIIDSTSFANGSVAGKMVERCGLEDFDGAARPKTKHALRPELGKASRYGFDRHSQIVSNVGTRHREVDAADIALTIRQIHQKNGQLFERALLADHQEMLLGADHFPESKFHQVGGIAAVAVDFYGRQSGRHDAFRKEASGSSTLEPECLSGDMEGDDLPAAIGQQTVNPDSPEFDAVQRSRCFALSVDLCIGRVQRYGSGAGEGPGKQGVGSLEISRSVMS